MTSLEPGTILWLPRRRNLPPSRYEHVSTIPDGCFGRPVLLLAVDDSETTAQIFILITPGGPVDVNARIPSSGQHYNGYLPIHPAPPQAAGIPSLHFCSSQKLVRNSWVYVEECYRCPTSWLQTAWDERWDEPWVHPHLSRKLDPKSLQVLTLHTASVIWPPRMQDQLGRAGAVRSWETTRDGDSSEERGLVDVPPDYQEAITTSTTSYPVPTPLSTETTSFLPPYSAEAITPTESQIKAFLQAIRKIAFGVFCVLAVAAGLVIVEVLIVGFMKVIMAVCSWVYG